MIGDWGKFVESFIVAGVVVLIGCAEFQDSLEE